MVHRRIVANLNLTLVALLAAPALTAGPLRHLHPERFEGSPLFRDWKLASKRELPQPLRRGQPQTRAWSYTFSPTQGFQDGLSVVLFERQAGQSAAYETTHILVYWKQEAEPKVVKEGRRRLQVHRILTDLDLAGSEDKVMKALVEVAGSKVDHRAEVKVPAPHELTVFHVEAHGALGFEIRNKDERP
jgi:hypothetical protein